jgi:hypothetical protein
MRNMKTVRSLVVMCAIALIALVATPVLAQDGARSPLENPDPVKVVRLLLPGRALMDKLQNNGVLDIAGNVARVPDGIELDAVVTPSQLEVLLNEGAVLVGPGGETRLRLPGQAPAANALAKAAKKLDIVRVQAVPDVVTVGRVDWFVTKGQGFLSVEAKTSQGSTSAVTLTVAWDTGPGTPMGSGGTRQLSRFVDSGVYMYHRLLFQVGDPGAAGPRPHKVLVTSNQGGEDMAYVSDWLYPVTSLRETPGYQWDFISGYLDATQLYDRIDALAAEFPDIAEIVYLPNKSNGYRRKAQAILGSTSSAARDRAVVVTSLAWGHEGGNDLSAQIADPSGPDQPLAVEVVGNLILVHPASDTAGAITSTAAEVIAALNSQAGSLVHAFTYRGNAGNGVVQAFGPVALTDFLSGDTISREPWPMRVLRIGKHRDGSKVGVLIQPQDHAREWVTPLATMEAAERLLRNYAFDEETQKIVNNVDVFIIPCNNPDGSHYSFHDYASQRKNMTDYCDDNNSDPGRRNSWGVDLNRNYSFASCFDGYDGGSTNCTSSTFQGPSPISEPEAKNAVWMAQTFPNIKFFMSVHSNGGQLFWQPGSYIAAGRICTRPPFQDEALYWQMAERILSYVKTYQDTPVQPGNVGGSADVLYSSCGNVREELYFNYGVYAMGWEIGGSTWNPTTNRWESGSFQPDFAARGHGEAMEYAEGIVEFFRIAREWAKDKVKPKTTLKLVAGSIEGVQATDDDPIDLTERKVTFTGPVAVRFESSEPATIYFTTDGSKPTLMSEKYKERAIREGLGETLYVSESTTFRWFSVDTVGNVEKNYDPDAHAKNYSEAVITIKPAI